MQKCKNLFSSITVLCFLVLHFLFVRCNSVSDCYIHDASTVASYLGITLDSVKNICVYEYRIIEGEEYPKSIYLKFNYTNPERLIQKLGLLPFAPSLNNDSSRLKDYEYAKLIHNFWKMRSTKESKGIITAEKKISKWWMPDSTVGKPIYAGFYNEFYYKKIVSSKEQWTGRLAMQMKQDTVLFQIDLFEGR
jgi:hypothetical protein